MKWKRSVRRVLVTSPCHGLKSVCGRFEIITLPDDRGYRLFDWAQEELAYTDHRTEDAAKDTAEKIDRNT